MKGVVFNLLQEVVERDHGADVWDALLKAASVDGAYTALGNYPHEELGKLVHAASIKLGVAPETVVRSFGRNALPLLARKYQTFFAGHASVRSFLLTLNEIIHPEVRKLYPGADVPDFDFAPLPEGNLAMGYRSARRLCGFAHGLLEGTGDHFGEAITVSHPECALRDAPRCLFHIEFTRPS